MTTNLLTDFVKWQAYGRATQQTPPFTDGAENHPTNLIKSCMVLKYGLAHEKVNFCAFDDLHATTTQVFLK